MNELNDFFKMMTEGKKTDPKVIKVKEIKENIQEDLGGLFSQLSSLKAEDPKVKQSKKIDAQVKESVKEDLGSLFAEFAALKKPKEVEPETLVEEVQELKEVVDTPIGQVPDEVVEPSVADLPSIDKYLKAPVFSEPQKEEVNLSREFDLLSKKFKFMEQWVGKIANAGPGSGAAEIYNLDMPTKQVTGDYSIGRKDYYIGVNADVKTYITLPEVGQNVKDGRMVIIKDESGHAQLTPIRIVGNIDNDPNGAEIRINNGAIQLIYRSGSWRIV